MNLWKKSDATPQWLVKDIPFLIKKNQDKPLFNMACLACQSAQPVLECEKVIYVSETEYIQICLMIELNNEGKMKTSILKMDRDHHTLIERCTTDDPVDAKNLIASFLIDFPDAVLSTSKQIPVFIIIPEHRNKQLFFTLNNIENSTKMGARKFIVAIPKAKEETKEEPIKKPETRETKENE